jgi:ankyrin repeat protein
VKLILQHGGDPNAYTSNGPSPVIAAASVALPEAAECVRLLLNAGADPGMKTDSGKTAFDIAVERGHVATVKLLHSAEKPSTAASR